MMNSSHLNLDSNSNTFVSCINIARYTMGPQKIKRNLFVQIILFDVPAELPTGGLRWWVQVLIRTNYQRRVFFVNVRKQDLNNFSSSDNILIKLLNKLSHTTFSDTERWSTPSCSCGTCLCHRGGALCALTASRWTLLIISGVFDTWS